MDKSSCICVGIITKAHGVHGGMLLISDKKIPDSITKKEVVHIEIDGGLVPFFVAEKGVSKSGQKSAILHFDSITSKDETDELIGSAVYIEQGDGTSKNTIHNESIIGYTVSDVEIGEIGEVTDIIEYPNNTIISVEHSGQEVLIPLEPELIKEIDQENQILTIDCPEGLIDLYLSQND